MKKIPVVCFVVLVLSVSLLLAFQTYVLKVKVQTANVRSQPDATAAVVARIQLGTLLEASSKTGDWYQVVVDDGKGNKVSAYISANVVDVVGGGPAQQPVQQAQPTLRQPTQAPAGYQQPAETYAPKGYSGGGFRLLGGLTSSNVSFDKSRLTSQQGGNDIAQAMKSRMGVMGGIGMETGSQISFEFNVMYMPKGIKFQGTYDAGASGGGKTTFDSDMVMNEISIPAFIKFKILPGSTPFLFGGGEVGYVISSKMTYSYSNSSGSKSDSADLLNPEGGGESSLNRLDYGLVFGGGYEANLSGLKFTVEARYYMGLANLMKVTKADESQGASSSDYFHTTALVFLAGIKF